MKKYTEMTRAEINKIVNQGGDALRKLNKEVADHIEGLNLSDKARDLIESTDINSFAEIFGGLFTAEEIESEAANYTE